MVALHNYMFLHVSMRKILEQISFVSFEDWETYSLFSLRIAHNLPFILFSKLKNINLREGQVAANGSNTDVGSDWLLLNCKEFYFNMLFMFCE